MTQLVRIKPGKQIEEAHMQNRALIARWALELGKSDSVVEMISNCGKTFIKINNYEALRDIFAYQLSEIQRIKSEGDYETGRLLVERYGKSINYNLHQEVLSRYEKLNIAPYKGFLNPKFGIIYGNEGEVIDIVLDYSEGYTEQMLRYSKDYSTL